MPAAAKGMSEKSAKAFVRYCVSTVTYAMATGNTKPVETSSARQCASCRAVVENIRGVYAAGGRLEGNGWRVTALQPVSGQPSSRPIVQAGVFVSPQQKFSTKTAEPDHFDGGQMLMTFFLQERSGEWRVTRWDQAQ